MHLFFDLDGTLTNPRQGIVACIRYALTALDAPIPSDGDLNQWIGPPLQESFLTLLQNPDRAAEAVTLYRDRFATIGLFENRVYDGIPETLAILAKDNTLWVTTSKPQVFAEKIIHHFQLEPFVARVYGSELDGTRTNKVDLLGHVLQTENINPAEVIMVGDRQYDMLGARHHNIAAIGVLWGFGSRTELETAGATVVCEAPTDLPVTLQSIRPLA